MKDDSFSEKISLGFGCCKEIEENLSAFVDGELPKNQIIKICDHLIECDYCKNCYKNLRNTQKSLKNYFNNSAEELDIPDESFRGVIVNRVIFAQKQRKIIYSCIALIFLASAGYFSLNIISFNSPEKDAIHKVKFIDEKPVLTPIPDAPESVTKEFTDEFKDKK